MIESGDLLRPGAALAWVFGAGACSVVFVRLPRRLRAAALLLPAVATVLAPLLVSPASRALRFIVALASIMVAVKLYDVHRAADAGPPPGGSELLRWLPNGWNLVRRRARPPRPTLRGAELLRFAFLAPLTVVCIIAAIGVLSVHWRPHWWAIEHCAKVVAVCAVIRFGGNAIASGWRLIGAAATDFSGGFFTAATPAEFWRRWNRPAGQFLREYIFLPAGGRRRVFGPVMTTFAVNGLVHEYVFGIAAGRLLGLALPFFLIQGLATAFTLRLRPAGWARALGIVLTLAFNLAAAVLIFACVDAVVPFYVMR